MTQEEFAQEIEAAIREKWREQVGPVAESEEPPLWFICDVWAYTIEHAAVAQMLKDRMAAARAGMLTTLECRSLMLHAVREARKHCPHACTGPCPNTLRPGQAEAIVDTIIR